MGACSRPIVPRLVIVAFFCLASASNERHVCEEDLSCETTAGVDPSALCLLQRSAQVVKNAKPPRLSTPLTRDATDIAADPKLSSIATKVHSRSFIQKQHHALKLRIFSMLGSESLNETWMWFVLGACCFGLILAGGAIPIVSCTSPHETPKEEAAELESAGSDVWPTVCASLFFTAMCCDAMLMTVIIPLTPQLSSLFGIGDPLVGFFFSVKGLVQIISSPFIAKLVNQTGPRVVVCGGMMIEVFSAVLYASSGNSFPMALTARGFQGVAGSAIMVGSQCFIGRVASGNEGSLLGLAFSGFALGVLVGPLLGGWLASPSVLGLHGMFWVLACVAALVLIVHVLVLYMTLPPSIVEKLGESEPSQDDPDGLNADTGFVRMVSSEEEIGIGEILQHITVWRIVLSSFVYNFAIGMLEPMSTVWAVLKLGIDSTATAELGTMWSATPLAFVLFTPVAGMMSDVYQKNLVMALGMWAIFTGLVSLRASSATFGAIPLFEAALFLVGLGAGLQEAPAQAAMAAAVGKPGHAVGFAILDMTVNLGMSVGPLIGFSFGLTSSIGSLIFLVVAGCSVLSCIVLVVAPFREAR